MKSGKVQEGCFIHLEPVPNQSLVDAPLVEREWIDRYVVELAEWGAQMKKRGFKLQYPEDSHPMAWDEFVPESEEEAADVDVDHIKAETWKQVRKHLAKFQGRTRDIDGHPYINFDDYKGWRGRWLKGNLTKAVSKGLVKDSWNQWVEQQGGSVVLDGVSVETIKCYIESYSYQSSANTVEAQGQRLSRIRMLRRLSDWTIHDPHGSEGLWNRVSRWHRKPFLNRVQDWQADAEGFLAELYTMQQTVVSIGKRYFDSQDLLFSDVAEQFQRILQAMEASVELFNDTIGQDFEGHRLLDLNRCLEEAMSNCDIDLATIKGDVSQYSGERTSYLVDMAKAEALDYLGDYRQAVDLIERHL